MHTFSAPHFTDDNKAREYLENLRWPDGAVCPHCGVVDGHYALEGKAHRPGLMKCADCREQFSVTVGTVFESSKVGLSKWLLAVHLLCSSKKGISSHQIHRTLGVTYKTAWFMTHRIRHAMTTESGLLGSGGGIVEADETYIGKKPGQKKRRGGFAHKNTVLALVERNGKVKSVHITGKNFFNVKKTFKKHLDASANLMTDEHKKFRKIGQNYASHETVNHGAKEYAPRGNVNTNTIEGVFSIFKLGMIGTYQHCDAKHLHRYLIEFDFRYNNRIALECDDAERSRRALVGGQAIDLSCRL